MQENYKNIDFPYKFISGLVQYETPRIGGDILQHRKCICSMISAVIIKTREDGF